MRIIDDKTNAEPFPEANVGIAHAMCMKKLSATHLFVPMLGESRNCDVAFRTPHIPVQNDAFSENMNSFLFFTSAAGRKDTESD